MGRGLIIYLLFTAAVWKRKYFYGRGIFIYLFLLRRQLFFLFLCPLFCFLFSVAVLFPRPIFFAGQYFSFCSFAVCLFRVLAGYKYFLFVAPIFAPFLFFFPSIFIGAKICSLRPKINGGILYFWRRKMKKKMQPKIKGDFLLAAASRK